MTTSDPVELPATLDRLADIRAVVERWCRGAGASEEDCHAVVLAVDEACTNVIEHGYAGRGGGSLRLAFEAGESEVRVTVRDTGQAFDPGGAPVPNIEADWEERPIGGLGWHLIRGMMDEVHYRSDDEGNLLTLVKKRTTQPTTGAT
jgi:anti-sigma regulatory factor (Ser/Thr protein kinase)